MTATVPSRELLDQALTGKSAALDELLDRNAGVLRDRIERGLPPEVAGLISAQDVVDIVRVEAHGRISHWRPSHQGSFLAWLAVLADESLLTAARAYAKMKRSGSTARRHQDGCRMDREASSPCVALAEALAQPQICDCNEPEPAVDWRKYQDQLEASLADRLDDFPEPYARVVRAIDIDGAKVEDVAAAMHRSIGWVAMARSHALARLKGAWPVTPPAAASPAR